MQIKLIHHSHAQTYIIDTSNFARARTQLTDAIAQFFYRTQSDELGDGRFAFYQNVQGVGVVWQTENALFSVCQAIPLQTQRMELLQRLLNAQRETAT